MINDHDTTKPRPRVLPIARAGREILGIGQAASYEAVRRGQWPTIKIGGRDYVVVEALERQLAAVK